MSNQHDKYTAEHIRRFGKSLENEIAKFDKYVKAKGEDALSAQRDQVERLLDLEETFQEALRTHSKGVWAYQRFVKYITESKGNILHARPYFRERQTFFTKKISPALKAKDAKTLMQFRANFRLIQFLFGQRKWTVRIQKIYRQICDIRNEICVTNTPLAMSRARIFYSKTPKSHLTYMDMAQVASEGLLSAIDKYVPSDQPFKGLANIAINRISGNLIERYSETVLHFWPPDKKRLYRGHLAAKEVGDDMEALADKVNEGQAKRGAITPPKPLKDKERTDPQEIAQLMLAASCVSTETLVDGTGRSSNGSERPITIGESFSADPSWQPDNINENVESQRRLFEAIEKLSPLKRKYLKLRGIFI